jgi:hypothetical protein
LNSFSDFRNQLDRIPYLIQLAGRYESVVDDSQVLIDNDEFILHGSIGSSDVGVVGTFRGPCLLFLILTVPAQLLTASFVRRSNCVVDGWLWFKSKYTAYSNFELFAADEDCRHSNRLH